MILLSLEFECNPQITLCVLLDKPNIHFTDQAFGQTIEREHRNHELSYVFRRIARTPVGLVAEKRLPIIGTWEYNTWALQPTLTSCDVRNQAYVPNTVSIHFSFCNIYAFSTMDHVSYPPVRTYNDRQNLHRPGH